jgi:hypothetical protein
MEFDFARRIKIETFRALMFCWYFSVVRERHDGVLVAPMTPPSNTYLTGGCEALYRFPHGRLKGACDVFLNAVQPAATEAIREFEMPEIRDGDRRDFDHFSCCLWDLPLQDSAHRNQIFRAIG